MARPARLIYDITPGEFDAAIQAKYEPLARAAKEAVKEAGDIVKREARADIGRAGFSTLWQNALRVEIFPQGSKVSANAAAFIFHKIDYSWVFEEGATIKGKPMLWLPLKSAPKRIGRARVTPKLYRQKYGPLVSLKSKAGKPLLGARVRLTEDEAKRKKPRVSLSRLSAGTGGTGVLRTIPLFVGVRQVHLKDRFSIAEICQRARDRLPALYFQNFRDA
jgi:hypothetical protein